MTMLKPKRLHEGDLVSIVAPSSGTGAVFPEVLNLGIKNLQEEFGVRIKEGITMRASSGFLYQHPKKRAEDINQAFADPEVKAIISTIGGDDSVRILPFLDNELILANPKIIMGYSDTNTILSHLHQQGMVTFYGPSVMAGFSQMKTLEPQFREHLRSFFFNDWENFDYQPYQSYSEGYPEWAIPENLGKIDRETPNTEKWQVIQPGKKIKGKLWGGCTTVLQMMIGSRFWPRKSFWNDKILFFETSEEKPLPKDMKYFLRNLGMQGILQQVRGLLFGRAREYDQNEKQKLNEVIVKVVHDEFQRTNIPIWTNLDFGHTDPQIVLPLGCTASMDSDNLKFQLTESAFSK